MYKIFMLKRQIFNLYTFKWENQTFFFETEEKMINFIKNGDKNWKPDAIRVECAFRIEKIDIKL